MLFSISFTFSILSFFHGISHSFFFFLQISFIFYEKYNKYSQRTHSNPHIIAVFVVSGWMCQLSCWSTIKQSLFDNVSDFWPFITGIWTVCPAVLNKAWDTAVWPSEEFSDFLKGIHAGLWIQSFQNSFQLQWGVGFKPQYLRDTQLHCHSECHLLKPFLKRNI